MHHLDHSSNRPRAQALKQSPQRLFWEACDTQEIQELFNFKVMHACLDSELPKTTDGRRPRLWPVKIVRGIKHNQETNAKGGRSRLCVVGINHQEGKEYSRKEAPTPMFATVLILIAEATVKRGVKFQFDLTQFFQQSDCDSPEPICLIPPRAHQRDEHGQKVYWVLDKWLQGAKGAGYSARMQIIAILQDNDIICFTICN